MEKLDMEFINNQISGVYDQSKSLESEISRIIDIRLGEAMKMITPKVEKMVRAEFESKSNLMERKLQIVETIKKLQQSLKIAGQRFAVKGSNIQEVENRIAVDESKIVEIDDRLQTGTLSEEEREELIKKRTRLSDNIKRDNDFRESYIEDLQTILGERNSITESLKENSRLLIELDNELTGNNAKNQEAEKSIPDSNGTEGKEKGKPEVDSTDSDKEDPKKEGEVEKLQGQPNGSENSDSKDSETETVASSGKDQSSNNGDNATSANNQTSGNDANADKDQSSNNGKGTDESELAPELLPNLKMLQDVSGEMFTTEELEEIVKYFDRIAGDYADYNVITHIMGKSNAQEIIKNVTDKVRKEVNDGKLKIDYAKSTIRDRAKGTVLALVMEYGDLLEGKIDKSKNINLVYDLSDRKAYTPEEFERLEELAYRAKNFATVKVGFQTKLKWKMWDAENRRLAKEQETEQPRNTGVTVSYGTSEQEDVRENDAHQEYTDELKVNVQDDTTPSKDANVQNNTPKSYGIFDMYEGR